MSITLKDTSIFRGTEGTVDTITWNDNVDVNGYVKLADSSASASSAGAGALKYGSRLLLSNGTDWLPIYIERDGTSAKPIYYLSDVAEVYSSDQTLYVNPHNQGDTVTYTVDFTNTSAPKYQTSRTSSANAGNSGVGGECVSTTGGVGGCGEGTGSSYDVYSVASYCMKAGMRLCTRTEIKAGAAQGSGCGFDNYAVWTSTTDGNGNYYAVQGNWQQGQTQNEALYAGDRTSAPSGFTTNSFGVRCCNPTSGTDLWEI